MKVRLQQLYSSCNCCLTLHAKKGTYGTDVETNEWENNNETFPLRAQNVCVRDKKNLQKSICGGYMFDLCLAPYNSNYW